MAGSDEIVYEANVLISDGDDEAALAGYRKAVEAAPGDERGYCGAATACVFMEKYEEAAGWMERLIRARPGTAYAHAFMGAAAEHYDAGLARACYDRALELDPGDVVTRIQRAYSIGGAGRKKEADGEIREALLGEPADEAAAKMQEIIKSLLLRGRLGKSNHHALVTVPGMMRVACVMFSDEDSLFEHVCSRDNISLPLGPGGRPDPGEALERAGKLADGGRFGEAAEAAGEAIVADPGSAEAHSARAKILAKAGMYREAIECTNNALALVPDDPAMHGAKGMLLERAGRPAEAAACYDRASKMAPGYMIARHLKCGLLAAAGDADGLAECYRAALKIEPDGEESSGVQDGMRAEYGELMRRVKAAGSLEAGFSKFMKKAGVGAEPIWGRGGGARSASGGRRVRAGRRR